MDCNKKGISTGGNEVEFPLGNSENDLNEKNWGMGSIDQATWNKGSSVEDNISEPPNKRAGDSLPLDFTNSNPSKVIGRMFYKTKLCCKFRVGTCPFMRNNCNFAHSVEELREPPPNWEKIVATLKEEQEVCKIPVLDFTDEKRESNMRQQCKDFLTVNGCQYGESCNFLHNEGCEHRESVAVCLVPGNGSKSNLNTSHRKPMACYKWDLTGNCSYGSNCRYVHGAPDRHLRYMSFVEHHPEAYSGTSFLTALPSYATQYSSKEAISSYNCAANQEMVPAKAAARTVGVSSLRLPKAMQNDGEVPLRRWKGPDKISKVYGDWIDDL